MTNRRTFIKSAGVMMLAAQTQNASALLPHAHKVELHAHLWVYASRFPPDWDCTPILDEVFADISAAGFDGLEIMEPILRHTNAAERLLELTQKHSLRVSGSSYYGDMWNRGEHAHIIDDIGMVSERLHKAGGSMIGLSVGDAKRKKTEEELDNQAEVLKKIMSVCKSNGISCNMHNHTYEMDFDMHDFKGTISRVPDMPLGPDLNWLVRAKVDPVWYIRTYGHKMVYMHLRDQYAEGKWTDAVGEGVVDFKGIAKALRKIKYNGHAAVELALDKAPVRPVKESWKISRNYVRKIFGW